MSTLKLDTIASRDGTESTDVTNVINGSAKAWVNFNGTGTVAIRESFNVSSITDNGTGQYTVNFTTAMNDANYSVGVSTDYDGIGFGLGAKTYTTSSFLVQCIKPDLSNYSDKSYVNCQVFR